MNDMVDKIAAALYGGNLQDCYHPEMFRRLARKALETMREPTKTAIRVAARQIAEYGLDDNEEVEVPGTSLWDELAYISWQAMIDEAMKDA